MISGLFKLVALSIKLGNNTVIVGYLSGNINMEIAS